MKTVAIDTNVILDFKLGREPGHTKAKETFKKCLQGEIKLFLPTPVLLELEWVLRSHYKQTKEQITNFIEDILLLDGLVLENKQEIFRSLNLFQKNSKVSFTDCIVVQQIHSRNYKFLTFDKDLEKLFQSL